MNTPNNDRSTRWEITAPFPADAFADADPAADRADYTILAPVDSALIVVTRGPNAGSRFHLDRAPLTAGRHPNSDIFLDDVTTSRRHAEFRRDGDDFVVVDVGSLNGTYLNGRPVRSAVLTDRDELQLGNFRLVFLTGAHRH